MFHYGVAKNPKNGIVEKAIFLVNYHGPGCFGVEFKSDGVVGFTTYRMEQIDQASIVIEGLEGAP